MSWQVLTVISVFTLSISILLRRILLKNSQSDPLAYVVVFQGLVGILTGIYAVYEGFQMPDLSKYGLMMLLSVSFFAAGHVISVQAFKRLEASLFSVMFATSAIWTLIFGVIVLGDRIQPVQMLGIILVFVSVAIAANVKGIKTITYDTWLGLLLGLLFGLAVATWAYVGKYVDVPSWTALSFLGPALLLLIIRPVTITRMRPYLQQRIFVRILVLATVMGVSAVTSLLAFSRGNVSIIAVLQQTSVVVTTILAAIFLNEDERLLRKMGAAILCFLAVALCL
jgi:drug/metabolite transporter (DMT)-like permease